MLPNDRVDMLVSQSKTKEDFKMNMRNHIEIMVKTNDSEMKGFIRFVASFNDVYHQVSGDDCEVEYAKHPEYPTFSTILLKTPHGSFSAGWNAAVNAHWVSKRKILKNRLASSPINVDTTVSRGKGQVFEKCDNLLCVSQEQSWKTVLGDDIFHGMCSAIQPFESFLRNKTDGLIAVSAAIDNKHALICLYVFQKRIGHADFDHYAGSYNNNYLVIDKMSKAYKVFVIDIGFVAAENACIAEESMYRFVVLKLGSDIVPQLPVNGVKVVPLSKDQEDMIDSLDSKHPCKKMQHSSIGERIFQTNYTHINRPKAESD